MKFVFTLLMLIPFAAFAGEHGGAPAKEHGGEPAKTKMETTKAAAEAEMAAEDEGMAEEEAEAHGSEHGGEPAESKY